MLPWALAWAWYFDHDPDAPDPRLPAGGRRREHTTACVGYFDDRGDHDDLEPQHCDCWCHPVRQLSQQDSSLL